MESKYRKLIFKNDVMSSNEEYDANSMFGTILTFAVLVKSSYERGILGTPLGYGIFFVFYIIFFSSFSLAGWGLGCVSIFLVSLFSAYSSFLILDCKTLLCQNRKTQYHDLCFCALGYGGIIWAQISIWGNLLHKISKYMYYAGNMMNILVPKIPEELWVFIFSVFIFAIGLFRYFFFKKYFFVIYFYYN
jgi:hypothetical protein